MKKFTHLTKAQRLQIKAMLDAGIKRPAIASALSVHYDTIYREIKRGTRNGRYDPEYSEERYRKFLSEKGRAPILSLHPELANYISYLILAKHKSPSQIMKQLQNDERFKSIFTSEKTIYNAIDRELLPGVTRESLNANTTTVFNNGQIHIAKWAKELLNIKDGDLLHVEVEGNKLIFTKE